MPPTRRSRTSGGPAVKGSQKTLAFNNSKVTKSTYVKEDKPLLSSKATIELGHVTSEPAVLQQAKAEIASLRTEEEERASKVSDTQIKKYWRECEKSRRAPRVHQEDLSVEEKILRLFDMSSQYGVSDIHLYSLAI
jgi:DNA polymerase delta subunit 4